MTAEPGAPSACLSGCTPWPAKHYGVLKGGWFKGEGCKESLGNLKATLGSTRENWGLVGYLSPLEPPPIRIQKHP